MSAPLVSVVIPCFNAQAWIAETVASVLAQRGVSLETVLVDDGSDDESVEIAQAAAGSALRIIRQSRSGVSHARNAGTSATQGDLIQYLDADDVLEPDSIRMKVDALTRSRADVAYSNWMRWERQPDGSFAAGATASRTLGDRPDVDLLTDSWWPPGALLYRRSVVERIGAWRDDLPIIQDARFLLDAALSGATFVHVDAIGLKYRIVGRDSLSRRDPRAFLDDIFNSASELHASWERQGSLDDRRRGGLIKVYAFLARSFFMIDRARFLELVDRLKALDPHFVPASPPALRAVSRIVGYPAAEHIAFWWRRLKPSARDAVVTRTR